MGAAPIDSLLVEQPCVFGLEFGDSLFKVQFFFNETASPSARSAFGNGLVQDQIDLFDPSPFAENRGLKILVLVEQVLPSRATFATPDAATAIPTTGPILSDGR